MDRSFDMVFIDRSFRSKKSGNEIAICSLIGENNSTNTQFQLIEICPVDLYFLYILFGRIRQDKIPLF